MFTDKSQASEKVFARLTETLATIDGIATADAFQLGALVREYGAVTAAEAIAVVTKMLFETGNFTDEEKRDLLRRSTGTPTPP